MEKQNSHGQPMEETRGLYCMCDSGVACCQLQHFYHFWQMRLMFKERIAWASELASCQSKLCYS